jgi:hypothetical protein
MKPWHTLRAIRDELLTQPIDVLILRLTVVMMLLHSASSWELDVVRRLLCGMMLLSRKMLLNRSLWLLLVGCTLWLNTLDWFTIDNHKFLIAYWCVACAFAVGADRPEWVLRVNARRLIALVFLFAVGWKLIGGEYLDGEFLHYTLQTDSRLAVPAQVVGGLDAADLATNRNIEQVLRQFPDPVLGATLNSSNRLERFAVVAEHGDTKIGRLDEASRSALRDHLYTAGELLRMDQLRPDPAESNIKLNQLDLFGPGG